MKHGLDDVAGDEARHAVIDAAPGKDHLRVEADRLRLVGQIIGIDADAVAADEARAIGVEIPFGAGGGKHLAGVEPEILEQHGKLVDQRDVHVALDVLDDLGGLRHPDRAHLVGAGGHHAAIDLVDEVGGLRRRARGDLDDGGEPVLQIAGIDALRRIADEEVAVEGEPGRLRQDRHANLFRGARIDRRFVDHHVARREHAADRLARPHQRREVRALRLIDRRRHRDDVEIAVAQRLDIGGEGEWCGRRRIPRR